MVREALESKKAVDVRVLDVRGLSSVTDFYVVATGNSSPHLKALVGEVAHRLKDSGLACHRQAGTPESQWMVADCMDFVVHVFSQQAREYYALEDLWKDAKRVE